MRKKWCKDCKQMFATPSSYMHHKRVGAICRPVEMFDAAGFVMTKDGWFLDRLDNAISGATRRKRQARR